MKFSYVTNNCLAQALYFSESREYESPFIGSIFLNDYQYVKMCKNYEYYISLKPVFSEPKIDSIWAKQNNGVWYKHVEISPGYPVMFLDDIEIHWIHENDTNLLLEKYNRRMQRYRQLGLVPLFMLSFSDLCNDHSKEEYTKLINDFTSIENSLYLTKYKEDINNRDNVFLIKDWVETTNERNDSHIYTFHTISKREEYFKAIINNKLNNISLKYSIIMPLKINETNSFKIFTEIGLPLYDKFLESEYLESFYIICPVQDIKILSKYTDKYPHIPFKFIKEDYIIHKNISDINGWLKQQIIKIATASIITTEYYLIVDSDMYLNQKLRYEDLFQNSKVKYSYEPYQELNNKYYSTNSEWWKNSAKIIDYPITDLYKDKYLMGVTPQIFITDKVKELVKYLILRYGKDWQKIICDMKFSEYTLYWLFMLKNNYTQLYTIEGYPLWNHDLERNILYYHTEEEQKIIAKKSVLENKSYFSVIQSYLPVNVDLMKFEIFKILKPPYDSIFLISSCLTPTTLKFFSVEERFLQTLDTIKSVKLKFLNSFCLLIEGSILSEEYKNKLSQYYDYILEFGNDEIILPYIKAENICHGEQKLLEKGIEYLQSYILPYYSTEYIFKLGARYYLSDKFDINYYDKSKYNFYEEFDNYGESLKVYTTGLYSVPVNKLEEFKLILQNAHNYLLTDNSMIEKYFYEHVTKESVNTLKELGLEGRLNYNGNFFSK